MGTLETCHHNLLGRTLSPNGAAVNSPGRELWGPVTMNFANRFVSRSHSFRTHERWVCCSHFGEAFRTRPGESPVVHPRPVARASRRVQVKTGGRGSIQAVANERSLLCRVARKIGHLYAAFPDIFSPNTCPDFRGRIKGTIPFSTTQSGLLRASRRSVVLQSEILTAAA